MGGNDLIYSVYETILVGKMTTTMNGVRLLPVSHHDSQWNVWRSGWGDKPVVIQGLTVSLHSLPSCQNETTIRSRSTALGHHCALMRSYDHEIK